jgi:hypothetical protein
MTTAPVRDLHLVRPREAGIALLASVLLLLMLASIGLASLNVVERDQQVAGYLNRKAIALHAADAAIARAPGQLAANGTPSVPTTLDRRLPLYRTASLVPPRRPPRRRSEAGTGGFPAWTTRAAGRARRQYSVRYWKIRVRATRPAPVARVESAHRSAVSN